MKIISLFFFVFIFMVSCKSNDPITGWRNKGLQIIPVDSISVPDTIHTTDTLFVRVWGGEVWDDSDFSHFDTTRTKFQVEIMAWAEVREWIGTMAMPPTDLLPLFGDTCLVFPPFVSGEFYVIVRQPDSTTLSDTTVVVY